MTEQLVDGSPLAHFSAREGVCNLHVPTMPTPTARLPPLTPDTLAIALQERDKHLSISINGDLTNDSNKPLLVFIFFITLAIVLYLNKHNLLMH